MMIDHGVAGDLIQERPKTVAAETASRQMKPELLPDALREIFGVRSGRDAGRQERQKRSPMAPVEDLHRLMSRSHRLHGLGAARDEGGQGLVAGFSQIFIHDTESGGSSHGDQEDTRGPLRKNDDPQATSIGGRAAGARGGLTQRLTLSPGRLGSAPRLRRSAGQASATPARLALSSANRLNSGQAKAQVDA